VSDLYAPVTAKVVAVNGDLETSPQLVNSDPYGAGWLVELQADAETLAGQLDDLLDADAYQALVTE
jgi:glycine cleavage system H protein